MSAADANYTNGETPGCYRCCKCSATGVKLWRGYNECDVKLFCQECAEKDQGKSIYKGSDQIGWMVPAVPAEAPDDEGKLNWFWGYSSVPSEGVDWWYSLADTSTGCDP